MSETAAERREAPQDSFGVPLPILPSENIPDDVKHYSLSKHHAYFLEGPERFRTVGTKAVRGSRVIRSEKEVHNTGPKAYHRFYKTSPAPLSPQKQFEATVWGAAGYIPKEGVDLWSGVPKIREAEAGELAIMRAIDPTDERRYKNMIYYNDTSQEFFERYLVSNGLSLLEPELAERFAAERKFGKVRNLGHEVLESLAKSATQPLQEKYLQAYDVGQLHPLAPITPEDIILRVLGSSERRVRLIIDIRANLRTSTLQTGVNAV